MSKFVAQLNKVEIEALYALSQQPGAEMVQIECIETGIGQGHKATPYKSKADDSGWEVNGETVDITDYGCW